MQGNPNVIAALKEALKEELTAIDQYFLHAEMCENWHYHKLANHSCSDASVTIHQKRID
jgi:bacterioferritin